MSFQVLLPRNYDDLRDRPTLIARLHREHSTELQIQAVSDTEATVAGGVPPTRPEARTVLLATGTSPAAAPHVAARLEQMGLDLVELSAYAAQPTAIAAQLDPWTKRVRTQLAHALRVNPWDVELALEWTVDQTTGTGRIDRVTVTRFPAGDPEKLRATWKAAVSVVDGWHPGCRVEFSPNAITLRYQQKLEIPTRVPFDYSFHETGTWGEIAVGRDGFGRTVKIDFASTPHLGIFGQTGSGKSVSIEAVLFGALSRGFEIAIAEPTKRGNDFQWVKEYVRPGGWGCASLSDALAVVRGVYAEGQRRAEIIEEERYASKWSDLPPEQLTVHKIRPLLLVVDEFTALAMIVNPPSSLPKDDPERVEMEAKAADQSRLVLTLAKILAELRYVGIHCLVATQVWNVAQIGQGAGPMRANLGARLLFGKASGTQLAQAFTDASSAEAAYTAAYGEKAREIDIDGGGQRAPGRCIGEIEGSGYIPFQGAYADLREIEAHLEAQNIPRTPDDQLRPTSVTVPAEALATNIWDLEEHL